jgi:hypothetical protein
VGRQSPRSCSAEVLRKRGDGRAKDVVALLSLLLVLLLDPLHLKQTIKMTKTEKMQDLLIGLIWIKGENHFVRVWRDELIYVVIECSGNKVRC